MINVTMLFPKLKGVGDGFPKRFDWLHTPFDDDTWEVSDPKSESNPDRITIQFDGVLAASLKFSDVNGLVDDLKRSLVVSVELGRSTSEFGKVGSLSRMRSHVNELKRIVRELWNIYGSLENIDSDDVSDIISNLAMNESAALGYPSKLRAYFENKDISSVPVTLVQDKRRPSAADRDRIYFECGIHPYSARSCPACREIIQACHEKLALYYKTPFEQLVFEKREGELVGEKLFNDRVKVLRVFANQSMVSGLFRNPLPFQPSAIDSDQVLTLAKKLSRAKSAKRTRNIEVSTFLKVMDAAARYVVDYSEILFKWHDYLVANQQDYIDKAEPSKVMGAVLRNETQNHPLSELPASPFPLNGLNPSPTVKSDFSNEVSEKMNALIRDGVKDSEIASAVGLTRVQVRNFRGTKAYYGRDLPTSGISLYTAMYNYLPLSCALILLAFTAGREKGVYGLKPDCIKETEGQLWIEMYVHKTLRQYQRFPAVKLMEMAVNVLRRLSEQYRIETGEENLFKFQSPLFNGTIGFRFDGTMEHFCRNALNLFDDANVEAFKFSEHQFRRFFAIMYFYRYEAGDFEALSHHLRHLSYQMTMVYLSEREQGAILRDEQNRKVARLAKRAVNGDQSLSGQMVDELIHLFKDQLILEGGQYEDDIDSVAAEDIDLVIDFPHAKGLCFGRTPRFVYRAKCKVERDGVVLPSILSSSEGLCQDCPNFLGVCEIKGNFVPQRASEEIFRVGGDLLDAATKKGVSVNV